MENNIEKPINNEKVKLEQKIADAKKKIQELEEFIAPYPDIVSLSSDDGLDEKGYAIFQSSRGLKNWKSLLEAYEEQLEGMD